MSAAVAIPSSVDNFLAALDAKPHPLRHGGWTARCPAHDDRAPSLSLALGERGLVFHCHAGCAPADVARAAGFRLADLFYDAEGSKRPEPVRRKIVKVYDYRDEGGELRYQKVRYEPKSFGCRRPCPGEGCPFPGCTRPRDGWHWQLADVRRVLYRLPELLAAPGRCVLAVEGEKDADALADLGFLATTGVEGGEAGGGGTHRWRDDYSLALLGRPVVVLPDLDPPGLRHADGVVGSLVRHGAGPVRVVLLPGEGVKDVSDWIDRCHPQEPIGDVRRRLEAVIKLVPGR